MSTLVWDTPPVYDEYKDEDWYLWFGSDDCPSDEKIDEEDYVPIRKIPKNPFMFVQVCAVAGKQAARIRSPLDRSDFWICDPRLIDERSDRWDFRLEFSTESYGFPKLLQFVFDSEKHVSGHFHQIPPWNLERFPMNFSGESSSTRPLEQHFIPNPLGFLGLNRIGLYNSQQKEAMKLPNFHDNCGTIDPHKNEKVGNMKGYVPFDPGGFVTKTNSRSSFFPSGERMMQTRIEDPKPTHSLWQQ